MGQELHIERKMIAFHLTELEKAGLVESKYGLSEDKRPVAVKYYKMTPKGREIYEYILSGMSRG